MLLGAAVVVGPVRVVASVGVVAVAGPGSGGVALQVADPQRGHAEIIEVRQHLDEPAKVAAGVVAPGGGSAFGRVEGGITVGEAVHEGEVDDAGVIVAAVGPRRDHGGNRGATFDVGDGKLDAVAARRHRGIDGEGGSVEGVGQRRPVEARDPRRELGGAGQGGGLHLEPPGGRICGDVGDLDLGNVAGLNHEQAVAAFEAGLARCAHWYPTAPCSRLRS